MATLIDFVAQRRSIGGDLLLHLLLGDDGLSVVGAPIVDENPSAAFVRDQLPGRIRIINGEAGILQRRLKIAIDLDFTDAVARADVPGVIIAFDVLRQLFPIFIASHRKVGLLVLFIFAGMNGAARKASDQR